MRLEHEVRILAPRERAWALLMDVPRAAKLVPGVQTVEPLGDGRYRGTLRVQVGPIRLTLVGDVAVISRDDAAGTAVMRVDASDRAAGGGVRADVDLRVAEDGSMTVVRMVTEAAVLGRIGELGQPLIKRKADQIMGEFAENIRRAVTAM